MLWHDEKAFTWDHITALHYLHYDLVIVWTAPLVLSFFGNFAGKSSWLLKQKMDSLEHRTPQLNTILDNVANAIINALVNAVSELTDLHDITLWLSPQLYGQFTCHYPIDPESSGFHAQSCPDGVIAMHWPINRSGSALL